MGRHEEFAGKAEHCVKAPMSDKTLAAFTSFSYNIGINGFCGLTMVLLYNASASDCRAMGYSNKAGGRVSPGLSTRRARESALCLEGVK
jgi:lysozyme